jgi:hypothetical protein
MADVNVYVAAISAGAAILGASISPFSTAFLNSRQARRDRAERHDTALQEACVALLSAVGDLRDQVADNHAYPGGDEMVGRLAKVRQYVTAAKVDAVRVALLAPRALAQPADHLAKAAARLAVAAEKSTDQTVRASNQPPDFEELEGLTAVFRDSAVTYALGKPAAIRARGRRAVAPPHDAAVTEADR